MTIHCHYLIVLMFICFQMTKGHVMFFWPKKLCILLLVLIYKVFRYQRERAHYVFRTVTVQRVSRMVERVKKENCCLAVGQYRRNELIWKLNSEARDAVFDVNLPLKKRNLLKEHLSSQWADFHFPISSLIVFKIILIKWVFLIGTAKKFII